MEFSTSYDPGSFERSVTGWKRDRKVSCHLFEKVMQHRLRFRTNRRATGSYRPAPLHQGRGGHVAA